MIVPTLNEVGNVGLLIDRLEVALAPFDWEIIFVDDGSSDGTPQLLTDMAQKDRRIRVIRRFGRRGLSSAVIEGALASTAPIVAVIDADMQHDETLLPQLIAAVEGGSCDLAVGSRYARGGSLGEWSQGRARISRFATKLSELILKASLADPMSGFFALRRNAFVEAAPYLTGTGYKILLDLVSSSRRPLRIVEIPYRFRPRTVGESKLDAMVALEFAALLVDKLFNSYLSLSLILFALIGTLDLMVHLSALGCLLKVLSMSFVPAVIIATAATTTFNFILNNEFTHRDKRLRGARFVASLVNFQMICGLGAVANIAIAGLLHDQQSWWLAGGAGAIVSSMWNFTLGKLTTWHR